MGMRGPVPDRSENLARPRERKGSDVAPITQGLMKPVVDVLPPCEDWHDIAKNLYLSLASSGQSDYYQESDWALAYSICDDLSHYKKSGKRSAQMAQTIYSALGSLLVTEGDRRRVRIELQSPDDEDDGAELYAIEQYRQELDED